MKIKPQVNGIHTTNKKEKSKLTITKKKQQNPGSGITKNGKLSQKKQNTILQTGNKIKLNPKAAKEQEGKSGKDGNVIKLKSLNSKSENNPVHPLFLKRDRMDIEKVSKIAVPSDKISTPGKQIKKNNLKKAKLSGQNETQNKSKALVSIVNVSPVVEKIKIQLKKKNKKKKSKVTQQQVSDNDKSAVTDETNQLSIPESPISIENDKTTSKKRKRNKNKKLKLEENQLEQTENVEQSVDEEDNNTIFVGNLPNSVKKGAIYKLFNKYGKIRSVRIRSAAQSDQRIPKKVAVITKDFHQDTDNINAFVTFGERFEARNALVANGSIFDGHHIRVDYAKPEKQHNNRVAIFVGNLPFAVRDDELWKAFENCGEIESVRVIRDKDTRIGKGFGYVNFKSPDGVELALQLEGISIQKRKLRIARASDPKTGQQTNKNKNESRKRKLSSSDNKNNKDSGVQKKKIKQEINELTHESDFTKGIQESKKQKFQGEKSAERRLKKQTLKKKMKKMRNEKHKKSVASLLTSKTGKQKISKKA